MRDQITDKLEEVFRGVCDGTVAVEQAVAIARVAREHTRRQQVELRALQLRFDVAKATQRLGKGEVIPTMAALFAPESRTADVLPSAVHESPQLASCNCTATAKAA